MNIFINRIIAFVVVISVGLAIIGLLNIKDEILSMLGVETDSDKITRLEANIKALRSKNKALLDELEMVKYFNNLLNEQLNDEKATNDKLNKALTELKKKYSKVDYNNSNNIRTIIKKIEISKECKMSDELKTKIIEDLSRNYYFISKSKYKRVGEENINLLYKSIKDSYELH